MVRQLQQILRVPEGVLTVLGPRGYSEERDVMQWAGMCQSRPALHWRLHGRNESSGMDLWTRFHLRRHRLNHGLTRPAGSFGLVVEVRAGGVC